MDPDTLNSFKLDEAFDMSKAIQERAHELEGDFWKKKQQFKKLLNKK